MLPRSLLQDAAKIIAARCMLPHEDAVIAAASMQAHGAIAYSCENGTISKHG